MLFLVYIPYEFEFQIVVNFSVFNVISMLIVSLWHIFKSDDRNPAVPLLWIFMLVLFPVLILFVPSLMARWGGYMFGIVAVLWDLGIFIVIFIIFIYLVNSRKKVFRETEVKKSHTEEKKAKPENENQRNLVAYFEGKRDPSETILTTFLAEREAERPNLPLIRKYFKQANQKLKALILYGLDNYPARLDLLSDLSFFHEFQKMPMHLSPNLE